MPVAKLIHFIWAGGRKLMPEKNITAVKQWAAKHRGEGFEVRIWIDETASPGTRARYAEFGLPSHDPVITLPDITEEGVAAVENGPERSAIRYEIDRLKPNYGASSDMLRYNILAKFGGAYFDSDVNPGALTLNSGGIFDREGHVLLIDNNSQGKGIIGNDAFICSAGHPLMRAIADTAAANYNVVFKQVGQSRVYDYDDPTFMQNSTILRTGPMAVSKALHVNGALRPMNDPRTHDPSGKPLQVTTKDVMDDLRLVLNQVLDEYWMDNRFVKPEAINDRNWIGVPIKRMDTDTAALDVVQGTIRFEVERMDLLRLDDHVRDLAASLGGPTSVAGEPTGAEQDIAVLLAKRLRLLNLQFGNALLGQAVSRYRPLRGFYYANGLVGIDDGLNFANSKARFDTRINGMREAGRVQMAIQFVENALMRHVDGVQPIPQAIVTDLVAIAADARTAFGVGKDQFSDEYQIEAVHCTPREHTGFVLARLNGLLAGLANGKPLPQGWRDEVGAAHLY